MRRGWRGLLRVLPWLLVAGLAVVGLRRTVFAPVRVTLQRVATGDLALEVAGTGTLEARRAATIGPRIQEKLAEVLVDEGDPVAEGQLLARLDGAELGRQVDVAEASLAAARSTVERVRADEVRAEAVLSQARLNHRRLVELLEGKVASQADFDRSEEALRVAESERGRAQAATREAESSAVAADRTLQHRREQLRFTEIRSPWNGRVVRRDRDPGEIVVPGVSILRVVDTNEFWVSAWVDETAVAGLASGQPARVVFRSEPERVFQGKVARVGREADRETRELVVDVSVGPLSPTWVIGQRADVWIRTGTRTNILTLPSAALRWRDGRPGVVLAEQGQSRWRGVELGATGIEAVEVRSGLADGDWVVVGVQGPVGRILEDGRRLEAR